MVSFDILILILIQCRTGTQSSNPSRNSVLEIGLNSLSVVISKISYQVVFHEPLPSWAGQFANRWRVRASFVVTVPLLQRLIHGA